MYRLLKNRAALAGIGFCLFLVALLLFGAFKGYAATKLQNRSDQLSNSGTGASSVHLIGFQYTNTTTPVGSVEIQFCSNSPILADPCTSPSGLNLSSVSLSSQTGETGFTLLSSSGDTIIITRNPSNPAAVQSSYEFDNVINPSSPGTYYVRLQTFSSIDASGTAIENGGIAIDILSQFNVNAQVNPYLTFCTAVTISGINCSSTTGDQISFGNFSTNQTSKATSQFVAATNAISGYSVTTQGTTMTSGNNTINLLTSPTSSLTGQSQFGINLTANSNPSVGSGPVGSGSAGVNSNYSIANNFLFNSGDTLVSSSGPTTFQKFTVSYIVNISHATPVGVYATTITYICLGNF